MSNKVEWDIDNNQPMCAHDWTDEEIVVSMRTGRNAKRQMCKDCGDHKITHYETKPERVIIAAIQEDPHAFDGMWYPTALSEDGLTVLAQNNPNGFEERNLFFITVSTEIQE